MIEGEEILRCPEKACRLYNIKENEGTKPAKAGRVSIALVILKLCPPQRSFPNFPIAVKYSVAAENSPYGTSPSAAAVDNLPMIGSPDSVMVVMEPIWGYAKVASCA